MSSVNSTIDKFVEAAERFNGVREGSEQHALILSLYNSGKPKDEYFMTKQDPWCAAFVGAIADLCGVGDIIPISASCERMEKRLIESGAKVTSNPHKGCLAFYDWNGDGSYWEHVGIVIDNSGVVTTIEGNYSDAVGLREIRGLPVKYYVPNWGGEYTPQVSPGYYEYYNILSWDEKQEIKTFPMLKKGSKGIYVKVLQDFLGLIPDGDFGPETKNSLLEYQCSNNLEADAICGRQTWSSFFVQ